MSMKRSILSSPQLLLHRSSKKHEYWVSAGMGATGGRSVTRGGVCQGGHGLNETSELCKEEDDLKSITSSTINPHNNSSLLSGALKHRLDYENSQEGVIASQLLLMGAKGLTRWIQ